MNDETPYYSCCTERAADKTPAQRLAFAKRWLLKVIKYQGHTYTLKNFRVEQPPGETIYFYLKQKRKRK